jgi:hypothetical protein
VPALYVDAVSPPCRPTPSDWLIKTAEGWALAPANDIADSPDLEGAKPVPVAQGETVTFESVTTYGGATLVIDPDGGFTVDQPMPAAARLCSINRDVMAGSVAELVAEMREMGEDAPGAYAVEYYTWCDGKPFVLRGDVFVEAGQAAWPPLARGLDGVRQASFVFLFSILNDRAANPARAIPCLVRASVPWRPIEAGCGAA